MRVREREIGVEKFCEKKMEENQVESEAPKQRRRLVLKPRSKDAGKVGGYSKTSSSKSVRIFSHSHSTIFMHTYVTLEP